MIGPLHTTTRLRGTAAALALWSLLAGCSTTPPTRFYALDAVAVSQSAAGRTLRATLDVAGGG